MPASLSNPLARVTCVLAGYPRVRYGTLTFERGRLVARNDAGNVLVDATPAFWRELVAHEYAYIERPALAEPEGA